MAGVPEPTVNDVWATLLAPPAFEHCKLYEYVLAVFSVPVLLLPPDSGVIGPAKSPVGVQLVGLFVADQVIVEDWPVEIDMGFTLIETTGGGGSETVSGTFFWKPVPPSFTHVRL